MDVIVEEPILLKRLAAFAIDAGLAILVSGVLSFLVATILFSGYSDTNGGGLMGDAGVPLVLGTIILVPIAIIFFYSYQLSSRGYTYGKLALGLRVVDNATGGNISFGKAFLRVVILLILTVLIYFPVPVGYVVNFLFTLVNRKHKSLEDLLTRSHVVLD